MAKTIMIQGTCSGAGKSLLAAGLCRVFHQDGLRVAPFKAQNMALNSFVTREGLEMGRAQVVQAQAAGIEPSVLMNPILLKPQSDVGSQVVVEGEVWGAMPAWEYFRRKRELRPIVLRAFQKLSEQFDIIVLEGAGSPAEINLKTDLEDDLVNMGMAAAARAPVLLAGDIDRGGVFASLYGTMELLTAEERALVRGIIINKFRGDESILRPGLRTLEDLTRVPVLGVVPMLDVDIDEEDSLSGRFTSPLSGGVLEIAVIRLPRMSNYTDFTVFASVPGVSLRYVSSVRGFGRPDLVILPGSKSTLDDLRWLRQSGLDESILRYAGRGGAVFGVCGGYQMLGETIRDPLGAQGGGEADGLGLLPVRTTFSPQKTRAQVTGRFCQLDGLFAPLSRIAFTGYEIHMGVTESDGLSPAVRTDEPGGAGGYARGNVCGCYVHGIFDRSEAASALLGALCAAKGVGALPRAPDPEAYRETQYDRLADGLRRGLDLDQIYAILHKGI